LVHNYSPTPPILHPCAPSTFILVCGALPSFCAHLLFLVLIYLFLVLLRPCPCSFTCAHFMFVFLVLFLVLLACVLWAVFMLICPFHAGTWPIAADRCGSVRWSDLSCGCAVPRPHPSPQFLKGPQEALRGQLGRRRACGLASLRPCILVSAHDNALDSDLDSDSGLEPPPRDA